MPAATHRFFAWLAVALVCVVVPLTAPHALANRVDGVDRVVAISDVHGAHQAMLGVLENAQIIDARGHWIGRDAHLVIVGDLLDRGPDSRASMDLVMRLESEAADAGGCVHMLLGNHEVMNLVGDLRYVSVEEYSAFAEEELADERQRAWDAYLSRQDSATVEGEARATFDKKFPAGFFAHRRAFSSTGKYGRWLLEKPLLVVINNTAFVHGGLSAVAAELGVTGINVTLKKQITDYVTRLEALIQAKVLDGTENFDAHPELLRTYVTPADGSASVLDETTVKAAKTVIELNGGLVHESASPLWYRGSVGCSSLVEEDRLGQALATLNVSRVVVGHTPTPNHRILERLQGKVLRVDTGMLNSFYKGRGAALILEGPGVSTIYEGELAVTQPIAQARRVGIRPGGLSAEDVAVVLESGEIIASSTDGTGRTLLKIRADAHEIDAEFFAGGKRGKGPFPQVAAYRLDRLLALDMVPVAAVRELDGKLGVVQFLPRLSRTEVERSQRGEGGGAWCPLADQFAAMYVFDALIYNEGRSFGQMLYSRDNWQLMLVGHERSFGTQKGRPAHLKTVNLSLNDAWRNALTSLDTELVEREMTGVLDKRRVKALLKRRDELLEMR